MGANQSWKKRLKPNIKKVYVQNNPPIPGELYYSTLKNRILMDISEYTKNLSESKIKDYIHWYPKSVKEIIKEIM